MYERTKNATESGRFFATNKWAYEDKNFKSLADSMSECDKKRYNMKSDMPMPNCVISNYNA
jgi:hypothetical protein